MQGIIIMDTLFLQTGAKAHYRVVSKLEPTARYRVVSKAKTRENRPEQQWHARTVTTLHKLKHAFVFSRFLIFAPPLMFLHPRHRLVALHRKDIIIW